MTEPEFFSPEWAAAVRDALAAGVPELARAGKLPMYWDFFDRVKASYTSSWALGCRDLPAGRASLYVQWGGNTVTDCRITGPGEQQAATYVLGMDYADADLRPLLDLEGLKQWRAPRLSGYAQLESAVDEAGFYDANGAVTAAGYQP